MLETGNPAVRLCEIRHDAGSCGFNLSKSKWDPYPWVSTVEADSPAATAGVLPGDCLLEVNGEDMLGLRVADVAARVRARHDRATVMLWNAGVDPSCTPEVSYSCSSRRIQTNSLFKHSDPLALAYTCDFKQRSKLSLTKRSRASSAS